MFNYIVRRHFTIKNLNKKNFFFPVHICKGKVSKWNGGWGRARSYNNNINAFFLGKVGGLGARAGAGGLESTNKRTEHIKCAKRKNEEIFFVFISSSSKKPRNFPYPIPKLCSCAKILKLNSNICHLARLSNLPSPHRREPWPLSISRKLPPNPPPSNHFL